MRSAYLIIILSLTLTACQTSQAPSNDASIDKELEAFLATQPPRQIVRDQSPPPQMIKITRNTTSAPPVPVRDAEDGPPSRQIDIATIPSPQPKSEPHSRYGNPPSYVVFGKRYSVSRSANGYKERGIASWYGKKFHNHLTSNRERYDMFKMTAAHKSLPIPTYVKVTNLDNGKQIVVRVNDRGPFHENRIIDLSYVAAKKLGIVAHGTGLVEVEALSSGVSNIAESSKIYHKPQLYLQVGAYSQKFNANKLAKKLSRLYSKPVHLRTTHLGKRTIYKVQLGPLAGVGESDSLSQRIEAAGIGQALAVIR